MITRKALAVVQQNSIWLWKVGMYVVLETRIQIKMLDTAYQTILLKCEHSRLYSNIQPRLVFDTCFGNVMPRGWFVQICVMSLDGCCMCDVHSEGGFLTGVHVFISEDSSCKMTWLFYEITTVFCGCLFFQWTCSYLLTPSQMSRCS